MSKNSSDFLEYKGVIGETSPQMSSERMPSLGSRDELGEFELMEEGASIVIP